jgi:putative acetyltransferase
MNIRLARVEERTRLLDLWERSVRATHGFLADRDIALLKPLVAVELASDALEWWVAASETEEPIAFLGYSPGTIEGLFVDPEHRGRGAGTQLIAHAQQLTAGELRVDVNEQNDAARGFYSSLGFEAIGRSATDDGGRPFPIIHMSRRPSGSP